MHGVKPVKQQDWGPVWEQFEEYSMLRSRIKEAEEKAAKAQSALDAAADGGAEDAAPPNEVERAAIKVQICRRPFPRRRAPSRAQPSRDPGPRAGT